MLFRSGQDVIGAFPPIGIAEALFPGTATRWVGKVENGISNFFYNLSSAYYSLTGGGGSYYGVGSSSK